MGESGCGGGGVGESERWGRVVRRGKVGGRVGVSGRVSVGESGESEWGER